MTDVSKVYDAFLRQITDDMYMELTKEDTIGMLAELLDSAIPWFEFPRKSLEIQYAEDEEDKSYFLSDLNNEEIKILAMYMTVEWIVKK